VGATVGEEGGGRHTVGQQELVTVVVLHVLLPFHLLGPQAGTGNIRHCVSVGQPDIYCTKIN